MSSKDNLITKEYTQSCYNIAMQFPSIVMGFICQHKFVDDDNFMFITPGVNLSETNINSNDQQYKTPEQAYRDGSDIIIVGSGIYSHGLASSIMLNYK